MKAICEHCGHGFDAYAHAKKRFCALACWYAFRRAQHTKRCAQCSALFHGEKRARFCSRKCAGLAKLHNRTDREPPPLAGRRWVDCGHGVFAIVDDGDFDRVSQYRWHFHRIRKTVVAHAVDGRMVSLHRLVLNADAGAVVDHANGDVLDNRRANLRLATKRQNSRNMRKWRGQSQFKGVHWDAGHQKWCAMIRRPNKGRYLGLFVSEEDAARAYDDAARKAFGEFAAVNFPRFTERCAI